MNKTVIFYWTIGFLNLHFRAALDPEFGNRVKVKFHKWAQTQWLLTDEECVAIIDVAQSTNLNALEPATLLLAFAGALKLPKFEGVMDITDATKSVLYDIIPVNVK